MSTETVTKKRGRPKKADKTTTVSSEQIEATVVTTSRQSTKSRPITTAKSSSTGVGSKKPARRKKVTDVDEIDDAEDTVLQHVEVTATKNAPSIAVGQPSSEILDEAKAFTKLRQSVAAKSQTTESNTREQKSTTSSDLLSKDPASQLTPPNGVQSTRSISVPATKTSSASPSPSEVSSPVQTHDSRSSFLSDFLSDTPDAIPEAPESAKISDRSAFKSQPFSVDDIVSGAGVSDLKTLTAAIEQKANVKQPRESAIPIKTPKAFKSHNLNTFPDKPQERKQESPPARKYVNPEIYNLSSFKSLKKTSPQATTLEQPSSVASTAPTDISPTTISQTIPPSTTMTQPPSQTQQSSQKTTMKVSSSPAAPQTQPTQPSTPASPSPSPVTPSTPRPPRIPQSNSSHPSVITPSTPTTPAHLRPKRPTEMSPNELMKNADFKSLRRRWTGVIVGIPVLVVTSWVLWNRLDKEEKAKGWVPSPVPVEDRRRGEMPKRILDDGGLERK